MSALIDRFAVVVIAVAAMMWGTDTLFRIPLLGHLSRDALVASVQLVFAEHVILTVAVVPILWRARREIARLGRSRWAAIVVIGAGASGLATVLFTLSFTYGHFIETLLLQKLQPLVALFLAALWLRERLPPRSYVWVPIGLVGAYLLAVPEPLDPGLAWQDFHVATALTAIGAAALWGAGTVLGRYALADIRFPTVTALRFVTALPALAVSLAMIGGGAAFGVYRAADLPLYLGLALIPGLVAMLLYYRGLSSAPASMSTLAELAFPITGVVVNMFLVTPAQTITSLQLAGTVVLWIAIAALDLENARRPARLEALEAVGSA
ncbi:MAG: DMT family transporter [Chloroflexota bacterium]|nr:DMT family transporter [Chloroflexota bacterium]